jgi:hypothetical protein
MPMPVQGLLSLPTHMHESKLSPSIWDVITYQPKIYLHQYLMGIIKSLKINFIRLNYREFYQTPFNQHQIQNLLILTFKIWVTEKLSNSFKIILECSKWLFRFIKINFRKITDDLNLFKSCGS